MAWHRSEQQSDPTVAAMERVLKAERAAEAKLRDCRQQAAAIVAAARERAGGIARRADARISKLHMAYMQKIGRDIALLASQSAVPGDGARDSVEAAVLAQAARRLAAKLTGCP